MNRLINKILKEVEDMNDDPFFKPKNIKKREEQENKEREEFLSKTKSGLQKTKKNYENKNYESKEEELFLQIFSKLHLNEEHNSKWIEYFLKDENDKIICLFNLKNDTVLISNIYVCEAFEEKFYWKSGEIKSFMKNMLDKYFKLYNFTPCFLYFS